MDVHGSGSPFSRVLYKESDVYQGSPTSSYLTHCLLPHHSPCSFPSSPLGPQEPVTPYLPLVLTIVNTSRNLSSKKRGIGGVDLFPVGGQGVSGS